MKKRKIFSVLLTVILLFSMMMAGCKKAEETADTADTADTTDAADAGDKVEAAKKIIIFQSKVEITDQLEACAKAYTDETGVEVEVWGTTGDDYFQQLKLKLGNNQGPTVFSLAMFAAISPTKDKSLKSAR
jgi:raffinose/stachyose/melibiose transport system substrate-binding protein